MFKRCLVVFVFAVAVMSVFSGCTPYHAKGMVPDINNLPEGNKAIMKIGFGIAATAYPIIAKEEEGKYFDEDLGDEINSTFVWVFNSNSSQDVVELVGATFTPEGSKTAIQPMTSKEMYDIVKRDYWWRFILGYTGGAYIGGPIWAANTKRTNIVIEEDLEGKILKFGVLKNGMNTGFLCLKIPKKVSNGATQGTLKLSFKKNGDPFELTFNNIVIK